MATKTRQLADYLVEGGLSDVNLTSEKPHIDVGILYPAYDGKLLDSTTSHSGDYGTAQSDGKSYFYTAIQGRKPIKDPRIGAHFGSQRHHFSSLQRNHECSGCNGTRDVYNIDGRDNALIMYPSGKNGVDGRDEKIKYNAYGHYIEYDHSKLGAAGDIKIEFTGYFNSCNLLAVINTDHNDLRMRIDGGSYTANQLDNNRSNYSSPYLIPRMSNGHESFVINHGSAITTPGIHTLSIENNATNRHFTITGVELYAQDTTSTANKSKIQIPSQNVVSFGNKFSIGGSSAAVHYDPFNGFTSGNATALATKIDTATSLGMSKWLISGTYYRPFNGGRVVKWIANDGAIKTSVTMMPPNAKSIADSASPSKAATTRTTATHYGTNTYNLSFEAHTTDPNEDQLHEIAKTFHVREIGNGSANTGEAANLYNDVSYLSTTTRNTAHVMEDGVTSFGGDSHVASTAGNTNGVKLNGDDANDSMWYGFIGTGLAIKTTDGAYSGTYAQNLPYGSHLAVLKNGRDSGAGMDDIDVDMDNIKLLEDANTGYASWEWITIFQPKKPPVPHEACIIADYMLMADFVATPSTWSGTHYGFMRSKGVRSVSVWKDMQFIDGDGDNFSFDKQIRACAGQFHSLAGGTADSDTSLKTRLPVFATNMQVRGHNMDSKTKYFKDDVEQTATDFAGDNSGSHMTTDLELGHHFLGTNVIQGQTQNLAEFEVATPTHTSHHYQAWETPYLKDLIGGDRNIEQTNLVVSGDGKTWEQIYRDTSYLGNLVVVTNNSTQQNASSHDGVGTEFRGFEDGKNLFVKNFAIHYDRVICLVDGHYHITAGGHRNADMDGAHYWQIKVNGTGIATKYLMDENHGTVSTAIDYVLKRGDYVLIRGIKFTDSNWTFSITKIDK